MVEGVGVIIAGKVPGLDEVRAVEENNFKAGVEAGAVEMVLVAVAVNMDGMAIIEFDDCELQGLHFLEQVCHELRCLVKHSLKVFNVGYEFFLYSGREFTKVGKILFAIIRAACQECKAIPVIDVHERGEDIRPRTREHIVKYASAGKSGEPDDIAVAVKFVLDVDEVLDEVFVFHFSRNFAHWA